MNARTEQRLVALLAEEIVTAARRITQPAEMEDALVHIERQISFLREVTYSP